MCLVMTKMCYCEPTKLPVISFRGFYCRLLTYRYMYLYATVISKLHYYKDPLHEIVFCWESIQYSAFLPDHKNSRILMMLRFSDFVYLFFYICSFISTTRIFNPREWIRNDYDLMFSTKQILEDFLIFRQPVM
jgi:hypothetical protein